MWLYHARMLHILTLMVVSGFCFWGFCFFFVAFSSCLLRRRSWSWILLFSFFMSSRVCWSWSANWVRTSFPPGRKEPSRRWDQPSATHTTPRDVHTVAHEPHIGINDWLALHHLSTSVLCAILRHEGSHNYKSAACLWGEGSVKIPTDIRGCGLLPQQMRSS